MELNERCLGILQYLKKNRDYTKVSDLAQAFNVTARSIRNDIDKLETFMRQNGYGPFEKQHNKGIRLKENDGIKKFIDQVICNDTPFKYFYSKEERPKFMITKLIQATEPINISYFEQKLSISRNTVLKELNSIEKWLENRSLKLIRKPKVGLYVEGAEIDKRKVIIEVTSETISTEEIFSYVNNKVAQSKLNNLQFDILFSEVDIDFLNNLLIFAEKELLREFSDEAYSNLLTHLSIMIKRIQLNKKLYLPDNIFRTDENSKDFEVAKKMVKEIEKKFSIKVPKEEIQYIALHLLGAKTFKSSEVRQEDGLSDVAYKMTEEIEKIYGITFKEKRTVLEGLLVHLRPAIYRVKFGLKLYNPLFEQIVTKYKDLFLNTKLVCKHLEEYINSEISEHEISYITLHFGAALENHKERKANPARIILVCGTGIGTAKILGTQLKREFEVEIVGYVSSRAAKTLAKRDYDLIVSTIDIPDLSENEYIKISTLLTRRDIEKLSQHIRARYTRKDEEITLEKLLHVIERNCAILDRQQLEVELLYTIKGNGFKTYEERKSKMLGDLLTKDTIKLNKEFTDWKEAILAAAQLLLDKDMIKESYVKAIFDNFQQLGPYMVVAPGIVLAHARPEDGVSKVCMSLLTLKEPIKFGSETNDPVKLVIVFGAEDDKGHLKALSQLMDLLLNHKDLSDVINAKKTEDVISIVQSYSQK
ncbi:BglG family transcription antiterminator [Alkalicella caledoniensis]|uniref:BglG family transcription antiterminator n=1 Tax=Alkalicella caledoniensis TaxID=2731377 RepID=A0A7G9WAX4_ALKCA|nr:BglG family transcription antiterminator [Alkalicella caledoniensis]QNO15836.1 BglG family transcription antiterminator [Alkalicella caledoniensis]